MEKLKKMAKNLDTVAKIILYINIGAAAIIFFVWIMMLEEILMDQNALREYLVLNFGSVKVGIAPEYAPSLQYTNTRFFMGTLLSVELICFVIYAIKVARRILAPMKEGLPFDESVSKNLKNLGILTLIGGGVWSAAKAILEATAYNVYEISEMFRPERITGVELEIMLDTTFLIIAAVIFLLSYIFKYGAELQKLSDETL